MSIDEGDAIAVFLSHFPDLSGLQVKPAQLPGSVLWTVQAYDDQDRPLVGAGYFVGPDGRLWTISSNPSIHDYDLATRLLEVSYREGLTDYLDEDVFGERVREITRSRQDEVHRFVADLRAGGLRRQGERHLP